MLKGPLDANRCSKVLKALADPERIKIVQRLREKGPQSVGDMARHLRLPIANASHHLKQLRIMGLIRPRKKGRTVLYSLAPAIANDPDILDLGCFRIELASAGSGDTGAAVATVAPIIEPAASAKQADRRTLLRVVNPSFEHPRTQFVEPVIDGWTIAGPSDVGIAGVFNNDGTAPDSPARVTNAEGRQLGFISSQTGIELTQLTSERFAAGNAYELSIGVALSYALPPRATDRLRIALFHGEGTARRMVAQHDLTNDTQAQLSASVLKFVTATTEVLSKSDPAVGKRIGILIAAVGAIGGYFNFDAVTLYQRASTPAAPRKKRFLRAK